MDPITSAVLGVFMRWVHILSVITLLGGMIFRLFILFPASEILDEEHRKQIAAATARRSRRWVALAVIALFISGFYNLAVKNNIPPYYPLLFGIKMLLALHFVVVSFLLDRSSIDEQRRNRMMLGVVISGTVIVLLSAYLRYISNWMVP
jgi:uncharacterized membrane protein